MKKSTQQIHVFLVHAHSDKDTVHKLYTRLLKDGIHVWLDAENLQPGQDWQNEIRKAILKSDVVIVCLSRGFDKQHGYRHEELKIALDKAKLLIGDEIFIIPVRLEQCDLPDSLRHLHRVDLFNAGGYKKLVSVLRD
ncbi:MAG: toll/interleukin-1 receptor domain-containing protein [Chloroflexota bacterium]